MALLTGQFHVRFGFWVLGLVLGWKNDDRHEPFLVQSHNTLSFILSSPLFVSFSPSPFW